MHRFGKRMWLAPRLVPRSQGCALGLDLGYEFMTWIAAPELLSRDRNVLFRTLSSGGFERLLFGDRRRDAKA